MDDFEVHGGFSTYILNKDMVSRLRLELGLC